MQSGRQSPPTGGSAPPPPAPRPAETSAASTEPARISRPTEDPSHAAPAANPGPGTPGAPNPPSGRRPADAPLTGTVVSQGGYRPVTRIVPGGTAPPGAIPPPSGSNPPTQTPPTDVPPVDTDPQSDRTPPVVTSLRFDPPAITDGSSTTLLIAASDDLSGMKAVTVRVVSPSGSANIYQEAQPQADTGLFAVTIPIPANAETGAWYVSNLFLYDRADNTAILSYTPSTVLPGGTVQVSSRESDTTPPEVRDVWLDKRTVSGGEQNLMSVNVTDDISGVAAVTGYFWSRSHAARIFFDCRLNPDSGNWEARLLIPAHADCGEWSIQWLDVEDKAHNKAHIVADSPQIARATFDVSHPECDTTPPVLDSLTLSPTTVQNEVASIILVTAVASDEGSGVSSMYGDALGPIASNGQPPRIRFVCARNANDPNGPWTAQIQVPQHAARGTWKVGFLQVQDKANNTRNYGPNDPVLAGSIFQVQ